MIRLHTLMATRGYEGFEAFPYPHVCSLHVDQAELQAHGVENVEIGVTSSDEPPDLTQVALEDCDGNFATVYGTGDGGCVTDIDWLTAQSSGPPFSPDDYVQAMEDALAVDPADAVTAARRFFFLLNKHTNWFFEASAPYRLSVDNVMQVLGSRQKSALLQFRNGTLDWTTLDRTGEGSVKVIAALVEFCKAQAGVQSEAAFLEAFELFANGQLRMPLPTISQIAIQPSSGFFFLFAEFFFFAHAVPLGAEWFERARTLTYLQEVFTRSYSPNSVPAKLDIDTYSACNYLDSKLCAPSFIRDLRAAYPTTTADLCERMARNTDVCLKDIPV